MRNNDLVALAVHLAGGAIRQIDIEFVADAAYELAPDRFCWKHYPDRIDLRSVQYALKNAALEEEPTIQGSMRHGYQMTPAGIEWAEARLSDGDFQRDGTRRNSQQEQLEGERNRLRHTAAYRKYHEGESGSVTRRDFEAFVRINEYFREALRTERIRKIDNAVLREDDLEELWTHMKQRFLEE